LLRFRALIEPSDPFVAGDRGEAVSASFNSSIVGRLAAVC